MDRVKRQLQALPPIPELKELYTKTQNAIRDISRSQDHLPHGSKKRRTGFPEGTTVETRVYSEELVLPKAAGTGVRPYEYVRIKNELPWQSLKKVKLKLDGCIAMAVRKPSSFELVTVKSYTGSDSDKKAKKL